MDRSAIAAQLALKARLLRGMAAQVPGASTKGAFDQGVEDRQGLDAAASRMEAEAKRLDRLPDRTE